MNLLFRFFFWRNGRKRKSLAKRKAPIRGVSLSAEIEEGCAPSTSQTFEKV